jgi:hypothetical protein
MSSRPFDGLSLGWVSRYNVLPADGGEMTTEVTQPYEVSLELKTVDLGPEEIEDGLVGLVDLLLEKASSLALGPVGAIHGSELELLFTVEAKDAADLHSKLREIVLVLQAAGIELSATSARREFALA